VEKFLLDFVRKCEQSGYEKASLDGSSNQELPSTAVWVYYFLAQHFMWHKKFESALQYVEKAIDHTPTLVDLYTLKAKIYKKSGDSAKASEFMDLSQSLDTADRYLNCKCTKYMLEAGQIDDASKMCERFTREGMKSDDALYEMQCLWYPLACAKAYLAKKDYGEALKRCHQIDRVSFILFCCY
jgi:tetratricopeptide (TPR) repeat protein